MGGQTSQENKTDSKGLGNIRKTSTRHKPFHGKKITKITELQDLMQFPSLLKEKDNITHLHAYNMKNHKLYSKPHYSNRLTKAVQVI